MHQLDKIKRLDSVLHILISALSDTRREGNKDCELNVKSWSHSAYIFFPRLHFFLLLLLPNSWTAWDFYFKRICLQHVSVRYHDDGIKMCYVVSCTLFWTSGVIYWAVNHYVIGFFGGEILNIYPCLCNVGFVSTEWWKIPCSYFIDTILPIALWPWGRLSL